jgi:hypothetical protein
MYRHLTEHHFLPLESTLQYKKLYQEIHNQIILDTWSFSTLHMFENSMNPAGGISDDLHIAA